MWVALVTFIVGLVFGYENNRIRSEIRSLKDTVLEKKTEPTVTSGNPALIPDQGNESSIVIPKSPQYVEWEEQQELEKLNRTGRPR